MKGIFILILFLIIPLFFIKNVSNPEKQTDEFTYQALQDYNDLNSLNNYIYKRQTNYISPYMCLNKIEADNQKTDKTIEEWKKEVIEYNNSNEKWEPYDQIKSTDDISHTLYKYDSSYELTESERDLIERTVMHEAGWCPDYRLLILTAQCIRNACELNNWSPMEVYSKCGYAAMSYANPRSKKAVEDVFDKGYKCVPEAIHSYYNCTMVDSPYHEQFNLAIDIDGNRFFY